LICDAVIDLRRYFSGPLWQQLGGVRDHGEVIAGFVSNMGGGAVTEIASDNSDVHIHARESKADAVNTDGGRPLKGRLFIPMNVFYRLPQQNESVTFLRPADADGPGAPLALYGDGGAKSTVPGWDDGTNLDANNSGIRLPEGFHIESTGDRVRIVANSGGTKCTIELQKGGAIVITPANGQTIQLGGTSHKAILDSLLADLATALGYIPTAAAATYPGLVPNVVQWAAFIAKLTSGAYQSTIVQNG
jgi:hypothetical protein